MKYKRVAIFGDVHGREKSPYYESFQKVFNWMLEDETINDEETLLISLGDIYDEDRNSGDINKIILDFFKKLRNKDKIIVEGNHDKDKKSSALDALKVVEGVELIKEMETKVIQDKNFLFLPHVYTDSEGVTLEEKYSNIEINESIDYCLAHIMDETKRFSKNSKVCDLSNLDIKQRIFGHDHAFDLDKGGNYLGSIQPNSSTEKDKTPKIYIIDFEKGEDYTINVPLFINYYDVTYPDSLPEIKVEFPIINIHDSLDKAEAVDFYHKQAEELGVKLYINRVFRKKLMNSKEEVESDVKKEYKTDKDYFDTFKDEKKLDPEVSKIVLGVLNK